MGLWTWLFGSKEKKGVLEPEQLRFVKNLCDSCEPQISQRWALGYLYEFTLLYLDGIKIDVNYNTIRKEWNMQIWSSRSSSFLYYYDCLSIKPYRTINYLLNRYDLCAQVDMAVEKKEKREAKEHEIAQEIKNKYLTKES